MWEPNPSPLQEQLTFLNIERSLQQQLVYSTKRNVSYQRDYL